jgi:predicted regulator of Ras-like GTPase activity (Roadblock/LC7/MglB family)
LTVREALDELLRTSSDVTQAAIVDGTETTVAGGGGASAAAVAAAADALWELALRAASGAAAGLDQLMVEASEGATFMVADGSLRIVALTSRRPAPGLVFYDLHACLRNALTAREAA